MVRSEFGVSMKTGIHPALYQCFRLVLWCNAIWDIFLEHFGPLCTKWAWLNHTVYPSIIANHGYPFMTTMCPSSDGSFQQMTSKVPISHFNSRHGCAINKFSATVCDAVISILTKLWEMFSASCWISNEELRQLRRQKRAQRSPLSLCPYMIPWKAILEFLLCNH